MTGSSATTAKAIRLRRLLDGPELVRAVGAHNGLTALLAARAGFEAIWASGFEISASHALPDASLLSMTQLLDAAEAMDMACPVPVIADCDTGFGGPRNVEHTVLSYERRGIAGICIEDKMFPKLNSFAAVAHDLVPVPDFVAKVKAGKAAQKSEDFILIARTEALVAGLDLEEAVNRARAYAEAGADAVLVHSKSREPLQSTHHVRRCIRARTQGGRVQARHLRQSRHPGGDPWHQLRPCRAVARWPQSRGRRADRTDERGLRPAGHDRGV